MWETVDAHLQAGRRDRAREALGAALRDFFFRSFVSGRTGHPLFSRGGQEILGGLRTRVGELADGRERAAYAAELLGAVEPSVIARRSDPALVFLVNHAVQILVPSYAAEVEQAIQDARFELGARASNVEGAADALLDTWRPGWEIGAAVRLVDEGLRALNDADFRKVEDLTLADFDAPEDAVPNLPVVTGIEAGLIQFACPRCGSPQGVPLEKAGAPLSCPCGGAFRAPIPSLVRMAAYIQSVREAESGISRCRICRGVLNVRRGGIMRTGFCSVACARQGRPLFGEFVPKDGTRDAFACECGAVLEAPDGAETVDCACGLKVWVPEAPAPVPGGPRKIGTCAQCGRNIKAAARRCMYCGTSR